MESITGRQFPQLLTKAPSAMTTGPRTPAAAGQQEAFQQAQKRGDSLARSVQEVIDSAARRWTQLSNPSPDWAAYTVARRWIAGYNAPA